jgi:hypothetical protein
MVASRKRSLVALAAAVLVLAAPAGAAAQGGQPIEDEYGLPPLDHHSHSGGGGGGGGGGAGSASDTFASSGAAAASPLRASDVRRGETNGGSRTTARARAGDRRVGIGKPVPPPSTAAADPRGGFDVLLLVLAGLAAAGLAAFAVVRVRRPGRTI